MELDPTTPDPCNSNVEDLFREIRELKAVVIQLQKDVERGYHILPDPSERDPETER